MSDLKYLTKLAADQAEAEADVERLEIELEAAKSTLRDIAENQIPELMDDIGVDSITTATGVKVTVGEKVRCGELKDAKGLDWLREHEQGGLIKSELAIPFAKGSDSAAVKLTAYLKSKGYSVEERSKVVWNTLAKAIREMMEEGEDVPLEKLGAYIQRRAKLSK